jgi:DNA-binding GntR family transcriptional regulator
LLAVRRAAEEGGGPVRAELVKVVKAGSKAAATRQHRNLPTLVDQFHELIAQASCNQELVLLLANVRGRVSWMFEVDVESRSAGSWTEHAAILDAVLAGDVDVAVARMADHLTHDERLLQARVADAGQPGYTY